MQFQHLKNKLLIMLIHELQKSKAYKNSKKRLGRWNGSWKGNYSTKGLKWQKARSGGVKPIWFEWGQTPLIRRIPKLKWFKRYYKLVTNYEVVNLSSLNNLKNGTIVNKEKLSKLKLISNHLVSVKILWNGKLEKKLHFEWIDSFSNSAKEQITSIWWEIKE